MDNFELYHNLCSVRDIIGLYSDGRQTFLEMESLLEQFSKKLYRVAVIGEFKRGKSSLVNTLLGTEILPTDILPATAVINKIVYDTTQRIVIHYKNGSMEETSIDEIHKYATKLDLKKEQMAESIREIIVYYPSVFGQSHIELIDTPGLNDNEMMDKTTIEILDKIDTAIVVISATMPLSMTEQKLICNLIEQKDIYHLTFVVTFIDRVSDEEEEQDRIVELLKGRIKDDTYKMFEKLHPNEKELLDKARKILKHPDVFAVSSKLAMQGFIRNNNSLIEKSRFAHFKIKLMALLTANWDLDIREKMKRTLSEVEHNFPIWQNKLLSSYEDAKREHTRCLKVIEECKNSRQAELIADFQKVDAELEYLGFSLESEQIDYWLEAIHPNQIFIEHLATIRQNDYYPEHIMEVLTHAAETCCKKGNETAIRLEKLMQSKMCYVEERVKARDGLCELNEGGLEKVLCHWRDTVSFPRFESSIDMLIENIDNILGNLMPSVIETYQLSCLNFQNNIVSFLASWRAVLLKHEREIQQDILETVRKQSAFFEELQCEKEECERNGEKHRQELRNAIERIHI